MQNQCQDNFSTTFTTYGEMQLYRCLYTNHKRMPSWRATQAAGMA